MPEHSGKTRASMAGPAPIDTPARPSCTSGRCPGTTVHGPFGFPTMGR